MLDEIGIRDRIAYPFSPKKTVAALYVLAELVSSPDRVEHPLLRLKSVTAADVRHFQAYGHPVTGSRRQAYPEGAVAGDVLSLLKAEPTTSGTNW